MHPPLNSSLNVYLKLEAVNPTGYYKDRMDKSMIEEAERCGALKPGMTVVEATGEAPTHAPPSHPEFMPDLMLSMIRRAREIADAGVESYYFTNQFSNRDALVGYEAIGQELVRQFLDRIDAFCGAVGSAGMIMGVSRVLKNKRSDRTSVVVLELASSPFITKGQLGPHAVDGIGTGLSRILTGPFTMKHVAYQRRRMEDVSTAREGGGIAFWYVYQA
ncbi:hypothetical protein EYZ11_006548 [Aspergillus tanneri]|uniref:Tryptophan synthase beta chain-like PALP domain-containing protein n=1 Tax=Aspergillus tanneri TaxID=1220188 RepID=A0A4S3JKZ3_9EURO|nr:hypothetical protein EYZ11_006548 [Aspergillus tanneri]